MCYVKLQHRQSCICLSIVHSFPLHTACDQLSSLTVARVVLPPTPLLVVSSCG